MGNKFVNEIRDFVWSSFNFFVEQFFPTKEIF